MKESQKESRQSEREFDCLQSQNKGENSKQYGSQVWRYIDPYIQRHSNNGKLEWEKYNNKHCVDTIVKQKTNQYDDDESMHERKRDSDE